MKKLLALFLIIFGVVFLVSCQDGKKEAVELTKEEINEIISNIDLEAIGKNVISLETSVDVDLSFEMSNEELEEAIEAGLKVKGKFNIYANLETFESSYVYANIELSYEMLGDLEELVSKSAEGNVEDSLDLIDLEKYKTASFKAHLYLIQGVLYVNLAVTAGGTTIEIKQYEELFTKELFDMFKEGMFFPEIDPEEFDLTSVPDHFDFFTYKLGDAYIFEYWLTEELDEVIKNYLETFISEEFEDVKITHEGKMKNYFAIKISNIIETVSAVSQVNANLVASSVEGSEIKASLKTNVDVELKFKGKMPKDLPKPESFTDYSEGFDFSPLQ